jgi:hypothetical protein
MAKTVTPSQLSDFLKLCFRSGKVGRPVYVSGPPGIGKTAIINDVAKDLSMTAVTLIAAQMDPTDIKGIPALIDGKMVWVAPEQLKAMANTILFFDEIPNADPSVQNSVQQLIHDRKCGELELHPNTRVVAAGNRVTDRAGAGKLTSAISSRFIHVELQPCWKEWTKWGAQDRGDGSPVINPMVLAFTHYRPELFHQFDPNKETFPCPRTVHTLSDLVYENIPDRYLKEVAYHGSVGEAYATEFAAFERVYKDITPTSVVLANPDTAPLPVEISGKYAMASALSRAATEMNIGSVMTYLKRFEQDDYLVMAVTEAAARDKRIASTPEVTVFWSQNQNIFK